MFLFNMRTTFSFHCTMIKLPRASTHAKEKEYKQENNVPETREMILLRATMPRNEREDVDCLLDYFIFNKCRGGYKKERNVPWQKQEGKKISHLMAARAELFWKPSYTAVIGN